MSLRSSSGSRFAVSIDPPNPYFHPIKNSSSTSTSATVVIPLDGPSPMYGSGLSIPASPSAATAAASASAGSSSMMMISPPQSPISQSSPSAAHSTLSRLSPFRSRDLFSSHAIRVGTTREQVCADSATTLYAPRATTIAREIQVETQDGFENNAPWLRHGDGQSSPQQQQHQQQRLHTAPTPSTRTPSTAESKESSDEMYLQSVWHENRAKEAADQRLRRHMNQLVGEWSQQLARFEQEVTRKQEDSLYAKHHRIPRVQATRAMTASFDYRTYLHDHMKAGHEQHHDDDRSEHWRGTAWSRVQLPPQMRTRIKHDDNDNDNDMIPDEESERPPTPPQDDDDDDDIPKYEEQPVIWNTTDLVLPEAKSTRRKKKSVAGTGTGTAPTTSTGSGPITATGTGSATGTATATATATASSTRAPRSWRDRNKPKPAKPAIVTPRDKLPLHVGMSPLAPLRGPTPLESRAATALPYKGQGDAATSFSPFRSPWDISVMHQLRPKQQQQQHHQTSQDNNTEPVIIPRLLVADAMALKRSSHHHTHLQAHPLAPVPLPSPPSHVYATSATALSAGHIDATAHIIPSHISTRDDMYECDRIKQRMASSGVPIARGTLERALVAPEMTLAPSPGGRDDFPQPFFGLPINPYATKEKKRKKRKSKRRGQSHK